MGKEMADDIFVRIKNRIIKQLDMSEEVDDERLYGLIDKAVFEESRNLCLTIDRCMKLRSELFNSFRRLDVLSDALDNPQITEIMVNGPHHIFIESHGEIMAFDKEFISQQKLEDVIQQIVAKVNRRVNEASPMADARLPDGSRVNVVLPPVAIDGPVITIRKFSQSPPDMKQLISWGSITQEAADFLSALVKAKYNIFISGGTGSGKTTFLGALAGFIPEDERVITIEDSAELRLKNIKNIVRLEARSANQEGEYEITIRDLIKNSLRMRPDRVVVGEIRSGEALDMLQAMNTGHDGSLSTGHANSAADMMARIETMVLMGMELPVAAIRSQIASAIDIIVHLGRLRDKTRKVLSVHEVVGIDSRGFVELSPLYVFKEEGVHDGRIRGRLMAEKPLRFKEKLERAGIILPGKGSE